MSTQQMNALYGTLTDDPLWVTKRLEQYEENRPQGALSSESYRAMHGIADDGTFDAPW